MPFFNHTLELPTDSGICVYDLTPKITAFVAESAVHNGHVVVFARHTTTAVTINEYEPRFVEDLKNYLRKLAPPSDRYLHNDLHLRPNIPSDEPINAHSHLMAVTLNTSELIPIMDGQLGLGTYQSILFVELDGPRPRTVLVQIRGEMA
jgi:secondary thiamine-phosphate synthase enzyme